MQTVKLDDFNPKSAVNQMSERKHPSGKKIMFGDFNADETMEEEALK